ncbi:Predicted nucleotide-binding protein, sugar kinase/HSP70/actin superfamily [Clostridium sp. USBA 49]|uniref:acyl-CoA dehydratase activase-related protein n=1 Tax=Clostridium sp. USBA 49 TaxID=1881060 RepID=UPI00099AB9A7|nr:acyl-CoA dehydratase activase-related protein [Clostridium sp. USBA 49]SKA75054.1 Predicted nucleotide-binding protein, sugar kinase/HSP70/actin superfamily [Clostridium sp. USBA 49]
MRVGIPKGLLYCKYYPFFYSFFKSLDAEIITSDDTNKNILNEGVKYCVDEACLPIKIFHGHVAELKDKCDILLIPRIMQIREGEYICPKFCGLPEMVINSISNLPKIIDTPIYAFNKEELFNFAKKAGKMITKDNNKIKKAYEYALKIQNDFKIGIKDEGYDINVALLGHPYNVYDDFINMNVVKKLNRLGIGVITEENIENQFIDKEIKKLYKKPFWTFARNSYGVASYLSKNNKINGIVYISSFACGIDSVILELIKDRIGAFPMLVLKVDEHTGEAGVDTRLEAYKDMLERRIQYENYISTLG